MDEVTIDLRHNIDFGQGHLSSRFRWMVIVAYCLIFGLLGFLCYQVVSIQKAKAEMNIIRSEEALFSAQVEDSRRAMVLAQELSNKAQALVAWQEGSIHLQGLLNGLLSPLPKEVLLEHFIFKKEKIPQQGSIRLEFKGSQSQLTETLESLPDKLEVLGLKLLSVDHMEMPDGVRIHYLCQIEPKGSLC